MDELFSLLQIKHHHESGEFDAIIVDCAPTGETLRLLSFPDVCTWWLEKVFPFRGPMVAAARPFAGMLDMSLPSEAVFDDIERLVRNLVAMNDILRDRSTTSIRLVMTPDRMVVKEAMRTFTYLNLYGYLTDAVVVNRVLPRGGRRRLLRRLARAPAGASRPGPVGLLARSRSSPRPYFSEEVIGPEMLDQLGDELFDGPGRRGRAARGAGAGADRRRTARATLRLALPFAERGEIELKKIGLEVVVRVAGPEADYHAAPRAGDLPDRPAPVSPMAPSRSTSRRQAMDDQQDDTT